MTKRQAWLRNCVNESLMLANSSFFCPPTTQSVLLLLATLYLHPHQKRCVFKLFFPIGIPIIQHPDGDIAFQRKKSTAQSEA